MSPDVSVVIGAYNAMPYLTTCLRSVVEQSIGHDRVEVVAIDDGSTDTTGSELDAFAAAYPGPARVVHQANSGGPSGPRNVGLDLARGRYVFFLDADDRLGTEALARMVAMADEQGSDVVLGKMVGVGRGVPRSMFARNQPRADLFSSRVWWSLSAQKLFRRSFVESLGLRFATHYRIGEDQLFTSRAYLAAAVISVVADHDCYYLTQRDDGGNITSTDVDLGPRLRFVRDICAQVAERIEAGPRRDHLLQRQFGIDLGAYTGRSLLRKPPEERLRLLEQARETILEWGTEGVLRPLRAFLRLRFHLIGQGLFDEAVEVARSEAAGTPHEVVAEGGTAYAAYPYFRDPGLRVPDEHYDVTRQLGTVHRLDALTVQEGVVRLAGHVYVQRLDTADNEVQLLLVERESGVRHRLPVTPAPTPHLAEEHAGRRHTYPAAGFTADIDLATAAGGDPLPPGLWDVSVVLRTQGGVERTTRLGSRRAPGLDTTTRTFVATAGTGRPVVLTTYFTRPYGNLTVDVGEAKHKLTRVVGPPTVRWSDDGSALLLTGESELPGVPGDVVSVRLSNEVAMASHFPVVFQDGGYRAALPLDSLPVGRWAVTLSFDLSTGRRDLPVPRPGGMPAARWHDGLRPCYAKPAGSDAGLILRVASVDLAAGVRDRVGKVMH